MKKNLLFSFLAFFSVMGLAFTIAPKEWKVKTDQVLITWELPHEPKPQQGSIGDFQAEIRFDADELNNSLVNASVATNSLTTDSKLKTKHLLSAKKFFDAKNHPRIRFESSKIKQKNSGFEAIGQLSFKEKAFEVEIPFAFFKSEEGFQFTGQMELHTKELGISISLKSNDNPNIKKNVLVKFVIPVKS